MLFQPLPDVRGSQLNKNRYFSLQLADKKPSYGRHETYTWPMIDTPLYLRFLQPRLIEAMADTPVVLIHGPRQCGKSTLARQVGDAAYLSQF
jgi:SpoVK/Ycf46/Vps4 family AAA+-type ATPase